MTQDIPGLSQNGKKTPMTKEDIALISEQLNDFYVSDPMSFIRHAFEALQELQADKERLQSELDAAHEDDEHNRLANEKLQARIRELEEENKKLDLTIAGILSDAEDNRWE